MPMYEFACRACGQPFEKKLRMSQSDETQTCPACGSVDTRRRISSVAVGVGNAARMHVSTPPPSSPFT